MIWNPSPTLLAIGPLAVRWYGALFALAFYIGFRLMTWIFIKEKAKVTSTVDSLLFYIIVGTVAGARLGHTLIYEPEIYLRDPIRILKIWEGGLASHGGALGVIFALWLWKKRYFQGPFLQLLDYLCIPAGIAGCMIRIGNFFNSEIVGHPSTVPWAVTFVRIDNLPRHPSMLYESFAYLLIFISTLVIFNKGWHRGRVGLISGFYFGTVFLARFLLEFTKELQVASEVGLPLNYGQLLSIPFVVGGAFVFVRALKNYEPVMQKKRA